MVGWRSCWLDPGKSLPTIFSWLLGFSANQSLLLFVQYWHHHIETRQIQCRNQLETLLAMLTLKGWCLKHLLLYCWLDSSQRGFVHANSNYGRRIFCCVQLKLKRGLLREMFAAFAWIFFKNGLLQSKAFWIVTK